MKLNRHRSIDMDLVARLEAQSRRSPAAYRVKVVALSVFGDVLLTATQVLPIALPILVGMLYFNATRPLYLGASLLVLLLFVWMVRPSSHFNDTVIARSEYPALYELVDSVRKHLDVPQAPDIVLNEEFNAGALQLRGRVRLDGRTFCDVPRSPAPRRFEQR